MMAEQFIPAVFFTLFFVVDPLGQIPVFLVYLSGYDAARRRRIIVKAILISILVSLFFVAFGSVVLNFLGISSGAFLIAGGILLFLISMDMLFARPSRTKLCDEQQTAAPGWDISVFPLAIPLLCGPGNIAALLMFSAQVEGDPAGLAIVAGISVIIFLITMAVMFVSSGLKRLLGETGISIIHRLMGLVLSALAVQFIINGLRQLRIIA